MTILQSNYQVNYYSIGFIFVGLFLYLIIKFGSDFTITNKELTVDLEIFEKDILTFNKNYILGIIDKLKDENNKIFALKNLSVKLEDIRNLNTFKSFNNDYIHKENYIARLIEYNNIAIIIKNIILVNKDLFYKNFISRISYEYAIKNGSFKLRILDNIDKFLDRNKIPQLNIVSIFNSVYFTIEENSELNNSQKIYSKNNALFLFLNINKLVGVFDC